MQLFCLLLRWAKTSWNHSFDVVVVPSPGYCHSKKPITLAGWGDVVPAMSASNARKYWAAIKRQFYKPAENYTPMIVVHSRHVVW